jgi:hypothetical protein
MELWNEIIIDRSWRLLQQLKRSMDFVLIGGWAVYFLTKAIKSKDIDIIIDFNTLSKLKEFGIRKNDKLRKYEIEAEGIDVDVYVPYYSKFILPIEEITKETITLEGFKVPRPEILLLLKLQAEMARKNAVKGQKDRTDILSLIIKTDIDMKFLKNLFERYNAGELRSRLLAVIKESSQEYDYVFQQKMIPSKLKKMKTSLLKKFKSL